MDQHHHQENCTELLFVNRRRQADQGAIVPFFVGHMLSGSDFIENCIALLLNPMAMAAAMAGELLANAKAE